MNWKAILKVVANLAATFAAGYGAAVQLGQPPKVAIGAGLIAAIGNQTGLHQAAPGAQ